MSPGRIQHTALLLRSLLSHQIEGDTDPMVIQVLSWVLSWVLIPGERQGAVIEVGGEQDHPSRLRTDLVHLGSRLTAESLGGLAKLDPAFLLGILGGDGLGDLQIIGVVSSRSGWGGNG